MDPITLHFNVFGQAGANSEGRRSLQVDDPRGTTVGAVKQQIFSDALEARKSVRFITSGRILEDGALLEECKLGQEAFIHVSISEHAAASSRASSSGTVPKIAPAAVPVGLGSQRVPQDMAPTLPLFVGIAVVLAGTGVLLLYAWRKRRHLPMHMSQLLCIFMAMWVYFALFYGLPSLFKAMSHGVHALGRVPSKTLCTSGGGREEACVASAAMQVPSMPPAAPAASPSAASELRHRGGEAAAAVLLPQ